MPDLKKFFPRFLTQRRGGAKGYAPFVNLTPPRLCMMLLGIFLFLTSPAFAQTTAEKIESLLDTQAVTYAQAACFVLEAADAAVTTDPIEAFQYAADRKWFAKKVSANDTARLDGIALLVTRSFGIKGGIFFSIAKNPHYAYRELVYQTIIQGRTDPAMTVSGDMLLFIINRVFAQREGEI